MNRFRWTVLALVPIATTLGSSELLHEREARNDLRQIIHEIACQAGQPGCAPNGSLSTDVDVLGGEPSIHELVSLDLSGMAFDPIVIPIDGDAQYIEQLPSADAYFDNSGTAEDMDTSEAPIRLVQLFTGGSSSHPHASPGVTTADSNVSLGNVSSDSYNGGTNRELASPDEDLELADSLLENSLPQEHILADEDLHVVPDEDYGEDYGDFELTGEPVQSVPEPGTLALLALGLAGMGLSLRRRKFK